MTTRHDLFNSPVGQLIIVRSSEGIERISLTHQRHLPETREFGNYLKNSSPDATEQLNEYFDGQRREFDLPLIARGTEFQRRVWATLRTIRFGTTWTYKELAEVIAQPTAVRAVGLANGRNPHAIVVPCHRVIGAKGVLTGYAGGLETKAYLLTLEGLDVINRDSPARMKVA